MKIGIDLGTANILVYDDQLDTFAEEAAIVLGFTVDVVGSDASVWRARWRRCRPWPPAGESLTR